jgi:hypothetical protein
MALIFETRNSTYRVATTAFVATGGLVIVALGLIGAGIVISLAPYIKSYVVIVDVVIVATGLMFVLLMLWWHRANDNAKGINEALYTGSTMTARAAQL